MGRRPLGKRLKGLKGAVWLLSLTMTVTAVHAQTGSSQVGGLVRDESRALVPDATITLTRIETGVVLSQRSNETGAYNFASVLPGLYRLAAESPGFRQSIFNELRVGTNAQVRWDFTLQVGTASTQIEVSAKRGSSCWSPRRPLASCSRSNRFEIFRWWGRTSSICSRLCRASLGEKRLWQRRLAV